VNAEMHEHYASGNWIVTPGRDSEFVQRWTEFLEWTRASASEFGSAVLIRDAEDRNHFISFASWESVEALRSWRSQPEFAAKLGACRALCDDFRGGNYLVVATV
jgi:heme-degrading monooxygenase HmoA